MQYKTIAGQRVSAMSLGTAQLGMNYGIANQEGKPDRLKSFAILKAALEAGVTAFDTARAYGDSEEVLGAFFKANPGVPENLFITTKLSSGLPMGSPQADVEKALVQSVHASLSNLGCAKVSCLLLHNAADMKDHGPVVANTLRRLVAEGLSDMAGVSVYSPEEADLLLAYDVYQAVQLPMSIIDQRFLVSGVLERLANRGIHIFVRSVFFQGLVFLPPEGISDSGLVKSAVPHLHTLRRLSEKAGMTIAQFAVSFLRDMPGITSLVLGADNQEQVMQNSALFADTPPLPDVLRHEAETAFGDVNYPEIMAVLSRPKKKRLTLELDDKQETLLNIGGNREVFWDDCLLEEYTADFRLEEPQKRELVLRLDRPWEGNACGYFHCFHDGGQFRLYYRAGEGFSGDRVTKKGSICALLSADGIHWERPNLGLIEFRGNKNNNIVLSGDELDNFFVFKDENPACVPQEQYKAIAQGPKTPELPNGGLWGYVSQDGFSWKPLSDEPLITGGLLIKEGFFDSLNTVYWDKKLRKYRLYFRGSHGDEKTGLYRDIRLAFSEDFLHFDFGENNILSYGDAPEEQLYTNGILPYYRAPHVTIGFPARYVERSWEPMFDQLPNARWRREKMDRFKLDRLGTALTDGLFMVSRDGRNFFRWDEPFLKPGLFREHNWVYGDCYQSWGLLETGAEEFLAKREISFFVGEDYTSLPIGIRRYTVRLDGFACLHAGGRVRQILTRPLTFSGNTLTLNMSTSAAGFVMTEFLDSRGNPIPGFSGEAGYRMFGDDIALKVLFKRDPGRATDLSELEGRPVRLRFTLKEAKLFAMQFVRKE